MSVIRMSTYVSSRDSERLGWSSPPVGATGHTRDMGPVCEHVIEPKGRSCNNPYQVRQSVVFASVRIDIGQAIGLHRSSKTKRRMDDCTGVGRFHYSKALGRVGSGIEPDRSQIEQATTEGTREKRGLDSPGGETARRRKGATTQWPSDSEPDGWLDK